MTLEVQRMIVASVRAADVAQVYKDISGSVDLMTAQAADLATVITNLSKVATLRDAFTQINLSADAVTKVLIEAAGGIDALSTNVAGYYDGYFTAAEKQSKLHDQLATSFGSLNRAMPETRDAYRAMVETASKDLSESGQTTLATLLSMQGPFGQWADAAKAASDVASEAAKQAAEAASEAAKKLAENRQALADSFTSPLTLSQASATVQGSGLIGANSLTSVDAIRSTMRSVIATATQETLTTISDLLPAFDLLISGIEASVERTAALQADAATLSIDLLTAQGKAQEATAATRLQDIAGMTAEQVALYDTNAATRARIDALNAESAATERRNAERQGLQDQLDELTMTSGQLLGKQRNALDESNRGLFDQIAAIKAANAAMAEFSQQIEQIAGVRANVAGAKQGVVAQMAGFNAPAYYTAQQAILQARFSSANSTSQKVSIAGDWQAAIAAGLSAQIDALNKTRDTRIKALQEEASLAETNANTSKQAARDMASALAGISDYAKGLRTGGLSTLSPEDKLAAAAANYQSLLLAAQGGDANAAGKLTGASDSYLSLAKDYYASSAQYSAIFGSVEQSLSALGAQASVYETIATNTANSYDLALRTAEADAQYQASLLTYQQAAVDQYTALDAQLAGYQGSLEYRLDDQIILIGDLGVKTDTVATKITQSQTAITASLDRVNAVQQQTNSLLQQVVALTAQVAALSAQTAKATTETAAGAALLGAA